MAYLLEFPSSKLPDNILAPPYVVFGINGDSAVEYLPPRISLNAVLHFTPKLAQYVLPEPQSLPAEVANGILHTPYVGIDIRLDIGIGALQHIVFKILQSAGRAVPKDQLQLAPGIITSISIRKTWLLLELPRPGIDTLLIHLQTQLSMGPPVMLAEAKALWDEFPHDSEMVRLMIINYIQAHINHMYESAHFYPIRFWSQDNKERAKAFKAVQEQFPAFGEKLRSGSSPPAEVNLEMTGATEDVKTTAGRAAKRTESKPLLSFRSSMRFKSASSLGDEAGSMEIMASALSEALRKVELEHEAESA